MDDYNESLGEEHWGVFEYRILAIPPKEYLKKGVPPKRVAQGEVVARDDEEARVLALLEPYKDESARSAPESNPESDSQSEAKKGTSGAARGSSKAEKERLRRLATRLNANEAYSRLTVPTLDDDSRSPLDGFFDPPRARIQVHVARKG